MENSGLNQHRFSQNPLEEKFAKIWDNLNTDQFGKIDGSGILEWILTKNPPEPLKSVTERDRKVAATIIQWLGSPVGQGFLSKVLQIDIPREIDKQNE